MKSITLIIINNIVKENNIDLFIDDSIKTCNEIQSIGIKSLIMTTRLNKNIDVGKIIRVNNWDEIYSEIQKMKNGEIK